MPPIDDGKDRPAGDGARHEPLESSLNRRTFLHSAALGVAAAGAARLPWPVPPGGPPPATNTALAVESEFELDEATIGQLQAWMQEGRYTSRRIVESYLTRIAAVDRAGPQLNSVIETNPEVLAIASRLDAERRERGPRGPLHGIPVIIKDVFDSADRMRSTAGSLALAGSFAPRDSFVVERLRAAGAVILGKANMSEWSNCRSTNATSGWSARGGLTRNPYVLDRNACGSSSGTAVAVSANLAPVGVGAETSGSIACPASANCLVGLKPTVGLIGRSGMIPVTFAFDSAGPMCRSVLDVATMLGALVGVDGRDITTEAGREHGGIDYTSGLDDGALRGVRLGVIRGNYHMHTEVSGVVESALSAMRDAGAVLVDDIELASLRRLGPHEITVQLCEFRDLIGEYLVARGPTEPHKSLADLIRFNEQNAEVEMRYFGQEWFESAQLTQGRRTPGYQEALARCRQLARAEGIDQVLREHQLDALVGLTSKPAFVSDLANGDHPVPMFTTVAAVAGYPHITVPAGFVYGLPVGVSFVGPAWSDQRLIRLAYAFERATNARRSPRFLPTAVFDK
jgi:amidase